MKLTRLKTTVMAGVLAASMVLPGMTAMAMTTVTDPADGKNNALTKTIVTPEGVSYSGETFTFTFEQGANTVKDSGVLANQKTYTIPDITISDVSSEGLTLSDGKYTRTITKDIDLSNIVEPGVYTYTIAETANTNSSKTKEEWTYDSTTYLLRVYVTKGEDNKLTKTMTIIDASNTLAEDATDADKETYNDKKVGAAAFTNKMTKNGGSTPDPEDPSKDPVPSLVVGKVVEDNTYEIKGQEYTFTLTFDTNGLNDELEKTNAYSYVIVDKDGNAVNGEDGNQKSGTLTLDNNKQATLKLQDGEYAQFNKIYAGTKVSINEAYVTNLTAVKIEYTSNGTTADAVNKTNVTKNSTDLGVSNVLIGEKKNTITYTNTYADVTVTGVVTNVAPYVTLVVVAVAAVAAYVVLKRRVAR